AGASAIWSTRSAALAESGRGAQLSRELRARGDAELRVHLGEVRLDFVNADELPCGDFLVREPARHELGDALLGRRESASRGRAAPADEVAVMDEEGPETTSGPRDLHGRCVSGPS